MKLRRTVSANGRGRLRTTRRNPEPPSFDDAGFTLFEILLAIFIFSIVIGLLFAAYRTLLEQNQALEEGEAVVQMARSCLDRIAGDLKGIQVSLPPGYAPPEFGDEPDPLAVRCEVSSQEGREFSRLGFASTAHLPLDGSSFKGIARIVYYVQPDPDHHAVLRRSDRIFGGGAFSESPLDPVLCRQVRSFRIRLLDGDGQEYETWDSETESFDYQTPRAIGIELEVVGAAGTQRFATLVAIPVFREEMEAYGHDSRHPQ